MKKYLSLGILLTAITIAPNVFAGQRNFVKGGLCVANSFKGNGSIFACEHIGDVTISQIYERGWKIVNFTRNPQFNSTVTLIIEQQG